MGRQKVFYIVAALLYASAHAQGAALQLTGPPNVEDLRAGRPFRVSVALADVEVSDQFEWLAISLRFNPAQLQPLAVIPGEIIPEVLDDPFDYRVNFGVREIEVDFLTFGDSPEDRINGGGIFFEAVFRPLGQNIEGQISFEFTEVQQFNQADPEEPIVPDLVVGSPLTYSVIDQPPAPVGDYNFDGRVDNLDHSVWQSSFGEQRILDADGNGDGIVSAADYTVWRDSLGAIGEGLAADGNFNGEVDSEDFQVRRTNFERRALGQSASSVAIPEPDTMTLTVLLAAWAGRRIRVVNKQSS